MEKYVDNDIEHGLLEEVGNAIKDDGFKNLSEKHRKEMLEKKKNDLELVDVVYQNLTNPENGKWEGWYGDYAGVPLRSFRFLHGKRYKIPRGLAKKINDMGAPVRSGLLDSSGRFLEKDGEKIRAHQMVPAGDF